MTYHIAQLSLGERGLPFEQARDGHATSLSLSRQLRKMIDLHRLAWTSTSYGSQPADWRDLRAVDASLESTLRLARRHSRELRARKGS